MFRRTFSKLSILSYQGATSALEKLPISLPFLPFTKMAIAQEMPVRAARHYLPSVMMRSGTSKGLFIHRQYLPEAQEDWSRVLLKVMGSADGDKKQIDGVGGATSTTSKVAVISKSTRPDADVDYTFAQVAIGQEKVDFSGNCGNIASGVGAFALDEGLVHALPGQTELSVRVFNTNTNRIIVDTIHVSPDGYFDEFGDYKIGGFKGAGSEIKVAFLDPAGSMTGKLFPTGNRQDILTVSPEDGSAPFSVTATLIDAANPFIFVKGSTLPPSFRELPLSAAQNISLIESIRRQGAVAYGLAKDVETAALTRGTPKIAILSSPVQNGLSAEENSLPDIDVTSFTMGKVHPTLQLTGAVCLGAAVCVNGTVAHELSTSVQMGYDTPPPTPPSSLLQEVFAKKEEEGERGVRIRHAAGEIEVGVRVDEDVLGEVKVESVRVSRTARRLFEGKAIF